MNYIILAAGAGTRLHPLTNDNPKCLFKLDVNTTILKRTIDSIKNFDIDANFIVVTGFQHDKVIEALNEFHDIKILFNPFYAVSNSIASLWFAKEFLVGNTTILNSDIVFDEDIVKTILVKPVKGAKILLDSSIRTEGDYNVQIHEDKVTVMSKQLSEYYGEYAGITKLSSEASSELLAEINCMINSGYLDQWYENALVQMIFSRDFELGFIDIANYSWTEVDSVNDLLQAKKIHYLK